MKISLITPVFNAEKYKQRQFLLWQSLYEWSGKVSLNNTEKEKINLQYLAYKLATTKGIKKYVLLLSGILKNKNILKTRYRFLYV